MKYKKRVFQFPDQYTEYVKNFVSKTFDKSPMKFVSREVLNLSDLYQKSGDHSQLWSSPESTAAYLCYFFPLNYLRYLSALSELHALGYFKEPMDIIDVGSGSGAFHLACIDYGIPIRSYTGVEKNPQATHHHQDLLKVINFESHKMSWQSQWPRVSKEALVVFSYSLNEMNRIPEDVFQCENLIFIEPSTQKVSRRLLEIRQECLDRGFTPWGPCPHAKPCPLLTHSKRDWCYDRIFIERPKFFNDVENMLPMRNNTITYSYLGLKKQAPDFYGSSLVRTIGDTQKEKGKSKQMICRSEDREFLVWFKKHGRPPKVPHGGIFQLKEFEKKSNEIRPKSPLEPFPLALERDE